MSVNAFLLVVALVALDAFAADQKQTALVAVRVKTDQPGADVALDGEHVGTTPLTLKPLPDGKYTLSFAKAGYEDHVEVLEIRAGKPASLFVSLKALRVPLPPLPVHYRTIHVHEPDPCVGDLTVHADRVEYRAGSGDHNLTIPFGSVRMTLRRHGATYLHRMQTLPTLPTVAVKSRASGAVAPVFLDVDGGGATFLAAAKGADEPDADGTRSLYELVYRLWDEAKKAGTRR